MGRGAVIDCTWSDLNRIFEDRALTPNKADSRCRLCVRVGLGRPERACPWPRHCARGAGHRRALNSSRLFLEGPGAAGLPHNGCVSWALAAPFASRSAADLEINKLKNFCEKQLTQRNTKKPT